MPRGEEPTTPRLLPGPMAEMPYKLLGDTSVSPTAKIIYLAIRHSAVRKDSKLPKGGLPGISIDRTYLLEDTGLTRETFRRGLAELKRQGWVAVILSNEDHTTVTIDGREYRAEHPNHGPDKSIPPATRPSTYILLKG